MYKLDELAELRAKLEVQRADRDIEFKAVSDTIREQLDAIDARWKSRIDETQATVTALEAEIRAEVLANGPEVKYPKGAHLQAFWVRGRESWDAKALDKWAVIHTEITAFRKVGEPSVTIRSV